MSYATETILDLLMPDRFCAWLADKPDNSCVGLGRNSDWCPIAMYLLVEGVPNPRVSREYVISLIDPPSGPETPKWAKTFISRVDAAHINIVNARDAREILESSLRDHPECL